MATQVINGDIAKVHHPLLTKIAIMTSNGLLIFHKSFIDEKIDSTLFSGFTAAILSFSKEIGSELVAIKLNTYTLYIRCIRSLIVALGIKDHTGAEEFANQLINEFSSCTHFHKLEMICEEALDKRHQFLDKTVTDILNGLSHDAVYTATPRSVQLQLLLSDYIRALSSNRITPITAAKEIINQALKVKDISQIREITSLLSQLLENKLSNPNLEKDLQNLQTLLLRPSLIR